MKKREMFNVGDYVRVIFQSYYELMKCEYNNNYYFSQPETNFEEAMLGGRYRIKDIIPNQWKVKMYQLEHEGNVIKILVPGDILKKDDEQMKCPYSLGEAVIFKPNFSIEDERSLLSIIPFFPFKEKLPNKAILLVDRIINEFYIFVNIKNGELIQFPMKWTDFVKKQ